MLPYVHLYLLPEYSVVTASASALRDLVLELRTILLGGPEILLRLLEQLLLRGPELRQLAQLLLSCVDQLDLKKHGERISNQNTITLR